MHSMDMMAQLVKKNFRKLGVSKEFEVPRRTIHPLFEIVDKNSNSCRFTLPCLAVIAQSFA